MTAWLYLSALINVPFFTPRKGAWLRDYTCGWVCSLVMVSWTYDCMRDPQRPGSSYIFACNHTTLRVYLWIYVSLFTNNIAIKDINISQHILLMTYKHQSTKMLMWVQPQFHSLSESVTYTDSLTDVHLSMVQIHCNRMLLLVLDKLSRSNYG